MVLVFNNKMKHIEVQTDFMRGLDVPHGYLCMVTMVDGHKRIRTLPHPSYHPP